MIELTPVTTACSKFEICFQKVTSSMRKTSSCTKTTSSLCQLLMRISCRFIIMPICCFLGRSRCTDGTTVLYTLLVECSQAPCISAPAWAISAHNPKRITPARLETLERRVSEKMMGGGPPTVSLKLVRDCLMLTRMRRRASACNANGQGLREPIGSLASNDMCNGSFTCSLPLRRLQSATRASWATNSPSYAS